MNVAAKSEQLRVRLDDLDRLVTRGNARAATRPIGLKVNEGEDIVRGERP